MNRELQRYLPDDRRTSFIEDGVLLLDFPNDKTGSDDTWPFNKNFHIILNLAWGGTWGVRVAGDRGL